jgi:hypothetical protein
LKSIDVAIAPRSGWHNVADIIVAPNAAFDRLRQVPAWGWAFIVAAVLGIVGSLLSQPAVWHAMQSTLPAQLAADPNMMKLPPDEQQKRIASIMGITRVMSQIGFVFIPFVILIAGAIQALVLTVANAIAKGDGDFKKYFALSITVSVVGTGLYSLILALIVLVRGASSFETMGAVQSVIPGLGMLVPGAHGSLAGFLGAFNVVALWATALLALGTIRLGRVAPVAAWSASVLLLLCTALIAAAGARNG